MTTLKTSPLDIEIKKQLLIGGQALVKLGSTRHTVDTDYLINVPSHSAAFIHDNERNIDYCNANGSKFFLEVWKMESKNIGEIATPQALLELKAYAFVQHCLNGFFKKADEAEFDIKFLVREFKLKGVKIVNKYISAGELSEVEKIIKSVRQ
jgi:hypothetical protein